MAPFWGGVAIGLAVVIPVLLILFAIRILMIIGSVIYGFVTAAHADLTKHRTPAHPPNS